MLSKGSLLFILFITRFAVVGSKPFNCEICGKTFRTSGHLKSHESSHFKGVEKTRRIVGSHIVKDLELDTSHIELQVGLLCVLLAAYLGL